MIGKYMMAFAGTMALCTMPATAQQHSLGIAVGMSQSAVVTDRASVGVASSPREWFPQDSADAVYRRARSEINSANYRQAIDLFRQLRRDYRSSRYVPQAMYWEAFALSRLDNEDSYRAALRVLDQYRSRYAAAATADAAALYTRIQGVLARRGDSEAAAAIAAGAAVLADRGAVLADRGAVLAGGAVLGYVQEADQDDVRMQALNALMQMDAQNAMPILRDVLANRAADRVGLRRRAVFLVAQKRAEGREEILLDAARNDPDREVREQAVRWLSSVRTDEAVAALDSILQQSDDDGIRRSAVLALSQHRSARAAEILQAIASNDTVPKDLRSYVIQWMGQRRGNSEFIRNLFTTLDDPDLKERALFALSQRRSAENASFLLAIALDENEDMGLRTRALFHVGQMRGVNAELYELYGRVDGRELKEQLIMVYGQRGRDSVAVEQLIAIASTEEDSHLRNRAIFWLGQTRHPRAAEFLRELINR